MPITPETTPPQITPPYGFQEIVALTKTHRVLLPEGAALPMTFRNMNPMPVSFAEFPLASRDYPLVFISGDEGKTFMSMIVTGLAAQQNLFVMWDNIWDRRAYLPAYVRRYPFCMTRVMVDGNEAPERVACVEKCAINNDKGEKLFDDKGGSTPEWETRQKLLFEYEADLSRTEEMCRLLVRHQLLEPFTMQATPNQGEPIQLTGMFRVAEEKLGQLDSAVLKDLTQKGVLPRIYAHLMSLDNFQRVLARSAALANRAAAKPARKKGD